MGSQNNILAPLMEVKVDLNIFLSIYIMEGEYQKCGAHYYWCNIPLSNPCNRVLVMV
jgi:hypothetical protein